MLGMKELIPGTGLTLGLFNQLQEKSKNIWALYITTSVVPRQCGNKSATYE